MGSYKKHVDTVVNRLSSHVQGRGRSALEETVTDPTAPIEAYRGRHRENVRLSSVDATVEYLETHDGDVQFGFD